MTKWMVFLLFGALVTIAVGSAAGGTNAQARRKRQYNAHLDAMYFKKSGVKDMSKAKMTKNCEVADLQQLPNSRRMCSSFSGCRFICSHGYHFTSGERILYSTCDNGKWTFANYEQGDNLPSCAPVCRTPCQNQGICIRPNVCSCPAGFEGDHCQYARAEPCTEVPPKVQNAKIRYSTTEGKIECLTGFEFSHGVTTMKVLCEDGAWVFQEHDFSKGAPACKPVCDPPCVNNGECVAPHNCLCPQQYAGNLCQYPRDRCSPSKLTHGGGYKCSSNAEASTCSISCPKGIGFESPPADAYVCLYSDGYFTPKNIPKCLIPGGVSVEWNGHSTNSSFISSSSSHGLSAHGAGSFEGGSSTGGTFHGIGSFFLDRNIRLEEAALNFGIENADAFKDLVGQHSASRIKARDSTCRIWSESHYQTFDGGFFSFKGKCDYLIARDSGNRFTLQWSPSHQAITLYLEGEKYIVQKSRDTRELGVQWRRQTHLLPFIGGDVVVEMAGSSAVMRVTSVGLSVFWHSTGLLEVVEEASLWNSTYGLCGNPNGIPGDDFLCVDGYLRHSVKAFVESWIPIINGVQCDDDIDIELTCASQDTKGETKAKSLCSHLETNPVFQECREIINPKPYIAACEADFCSCSSNPEGAADCGCATLQAYVLRCKSAGVHITQWRDDSLCPMSCDAGEEYHLCGNGADRQCGTLAAQVDQDEEEVTAVEVCVEGCYCPTGFDRHPETRQCVPRSECPCKYRGKVYNKGKVILQDCNSCECLGGTWKCTSQTCGARCSVVGDPHYTTFDGKSFDFQGKCSYYLVKGEDHSIQVENVPCSGAISEAMNFPQSMLKLTPSCAKSVTISFRDTVIQLFGGGQVTINGITAKRLPYLIRGAYIRRVSSVFVTVDLANGLKVWWDSFARVYVDAPGELRGKTLGLCGTFDLTQNNDFLTPEGDVEQNAVSFAHKWQVDDQCQQEDEPPHPCSTNPANFEMAKTVCMQMQADIFKDCHEYVEPTVYVTRCIYDTCACANTHDNSGACMCPAISDYAQACIDQGVHIAWRSAINQCGLHCMNGEEYQTCASACVTTCRDISLKGETPEGIECQERCVEGCACPAGMVKDDQGQCILKEACPCIYHDQVFPNGHELLQKIMGAVMNCVCNGGAWACEAVNRNETMMGDQTQCDEDQIFTYCENSNPITCQNMHAPPNQQTPKTCESGCECAGDRVLNKETGKCVYRHQCPCHHGGMSYSEGAVITQDCNTCKCSGSQWKCTKIACPAVCHAWGGHVLTFDQRLYDFDGVCSYALFRAVDTTPFKVLVAIQNVACGTSGRGCSKAVKILAGNEAIVFRRHLPVPSSLHLKRMVVREAGLFVFVDIPAVGVVVQWDRGTRISIRASPSLKGAVEGLCGNYNGNLLDDLTTPAKSKEVSVTGFVASWSLQSYCRPPRLPRDECQLHPERRTWAEYRCQVLLAEVFQPCHSEVPPKTFYERCVQDACSCDMGGDCECLCTAVAAYEQLCASRGVPIRWRSQDLCPVQCDVNCSHYEACVETCPVATCENHLVINAASKMCHADTCVEGCKLEGCPKGKVYLSMEEKRCVPVEECKTPCLEKDGVLYYEGDLVSSDNCHKCYCSRNQILCKGRPCPVIVPTTPTPTSTTSTTTASTTSTSTSTIIYVHETPSTTEIPMKEFACVDGWTNWHSSGRPSDLQGTDKEPVVTSSIGGTPDKDSSEKTICRPDQVVAIDCRVIETKVPWHISGDKVFCDPVHGLVCNNGPGRNPCKDYEIRVKCSCSKPLTCEDGWTPWFGPEKPGLEVVSLSTADLRNNYGFCKDESLVEVRCRGINPSTSTGHEIPPDTCDFTGLYCDNSRRKGRGDTVPDCDSYQIQYKCSCECRAGLGMEDGRIEGSQIVASSSLMETTTGVAARYNGNSAWIPSSVLGQEKTYLTIHFKRLTEVTGLRVQPHPVESFWVETFQFAYTEDNQKWQRLMDDQGPLEFRGPTRRGEEVKIDLPYPIEASSVSIIPTRSHGYPALRVELLGCAVKECYTEDGELCLFPFTYRGKTYDYCIDQDEVTNWCATEIDEKNNVIAIGRCGKNCPKEIPGPTCIDGPSPWMSIDKPTSFSQDDIEVFDDLRENYTFCQDHQIKLVSCRPIDKNLRSNRQNIVCDKKNGLVCLAQNQAPNGCYDYEVQVHCDCSLPEPPPTTTTVTTTTTITPLCMYGELREDRTDCTRFYKCLGTTWDDLVCEDGKFFFAAENDCLPAVYVANYRPECYVTQPPPPCEPGALKDVFADCSRFERCDGTAWREEVCPDGLYFLKDGCYSPSSVAQTRKECEVLTCEKGANFYWTPWFNTTHPSEDEGDFERVKLLRKKGYDVCESSEIIGIECVYRDMDEQGQERLYPSSQSGQIVSCKKNKGLACNNVDGRMCFDYAVRFKCSCVGTTHIPFTTPGTLCPDGKEWSTCAIRCSDSCHFYKTQLIYQKKCDADCVPGCGWPENGGSLCPPGEVAYDNSTCIAKDGCSCIVDGQFLKPTETMKKSKCETYQCIDNEIKVREDCCKWNGEWIESGKTFFIDECKEYHCVGNSLELINNCIAQEPPQECDTWTAWQNLNKPSEMGEFESLEKLRKENSIWKNYCQHRNPDYARCRIARYDDHIFNDKNASEVTQQNVRCEVHGLACYADQNIGSNGGNGCYDYEIQYFCACKPVSTVTSTETPSISTSTTPVSPPTPCDESFVSLIRSQPRLANGAFSASSFTEKFEPWKARLDGFPDEAWLPNTNDKDLWLEVDLGDVVPVYGVVVGSPSALDRRVTSAVIFFSTDKQKWHEAKNYNQERLKINGPSHPGNSVKTIFPIPFEARYVKLVPIMWNQYPAVKIDILGCGIETTTTTITTMIVTPTTPPECQDDMGIDNEIITADQITVSSSISHMYTEKQLPLNSAYAWIADISKGKNPYVLIDLLEPRNLTGIVTAGFPTTNYYVSSFQVWYGLDPNSLVPVKEPSGRIKEFPGNTDGSTTVTNWFDTLIRARYVKVVVRTYFQAPAFRLQIKGCYETYTTVTTTTYTPMSTSTVTPTSSTTTTTPTTVCNTCPGYESQDEDQCSCDDEHFWDGFSCVTRDQCPCYANGRRYEVGSVYIGEDCRECTCSLHGNSECHPQVCQNTCDENERWFMSDTCTCECEPCPENHTLCVSSNICLSEQQLCDNVKDCEVEICPTTTTVSTVISSTITPPRKVCDEWTSWIDLSTPGISGEYEKPDSVTDYCDGNMPEKARCRAKGSDRVFDSSSTEISGQILRCNLTGLECNNWENSEPCLDYEVSFFCTCPPSEATCKMEGKTFTTFDNKVYQYDICNHTLAQDKANYNWEVNVVMECELVTTCHRYIEIVQDDHNLIVTPSLTIEYDLQTYSLHQAQKIGSNYRAFTLTRVGNSIIFESAKYGFWVEWDTYMNAVIGVTSKMLYNVNGLCGLYSGTSSDDYEGPDGEQVDFSQDFGDLWSLQEEDCVELPCDNNVQERALEACKAVNTYPFDQCHEDISPNNFTHYCVEFMCQCTLSGLDFEKCRCDLLSKYATECIASLDKDEDLYRWRSEHNCEPPRCTGDLEYHQCYDMTNFKTCDTLMVKGENTHVDTTKCVEGCFCPHGTVLMEKDKCVKPERCRDCVCEGYGDPHFTSFDDFKYTFNGNCTYVASRDISHHSSHDFQVLITTVNCHDEGGTTCVEGVTLLSQGNMLYFRHTQEEEELLVTHNNEELTEFPANLGWAIVEEHMTSFSVLVPSIQLELQYFLYNFQYWLRLPSHFYYNRTEGLCGNCNHDPKDDSVSRDGVISDSIDEFAMSWLVKHPPTEVQENEETCVALPPPPECKRPNAATLCEVIYDETLFGLCHLVVNPKSYYEGCKFDVCHSSNPDASKCRALLAYARRCQDIGICLGNWRSEHLCPAKCPAGMQYQPCTTGCAATCDTVKLIKTNPDEKREESDYNYDYIDIDSITEVDTSQVILLPDMDTFEEECEFSRTDGCVCPSGQVLDRGHCVDAINCYTCLDGHRHNETWSPDACTNCTCDLDGIKCQVRRCQQEVCGYNEETTQKGGPDDACCGPLVTCSQCAAPPICTNYQELIIITHPGNNTCGKYECQCRVETCPERPELEEEGEILNITTSEDNCCTIYETVCDESTCHQMKSCDTEFYEEKLIQGKCCPKVECIPKPGCVYTYKYSISENGYQIEVSDKNSTKTLKTPNETWEDGLCRKCKCQDLEESTTVETVCQEDTCLSPAEDPRSEDYVVVEKPEPNKCCPLLVPIACKVGDVQYQENEKFEDPNGDPCIYWSCESRHPTNTALNPSVEIDVVPTIEEEDLLVAVVKKEYIRACNKTCTPGYVYKEPSSEGICCGECVLKYCIFNDSQLYELGEQWQSDDFCISYSCTHDGHIASTQKDCPLPPQNTDFIYTSKKVEGQCCLLFEEVACVIEDQRVEPGSSILLDECTTGFCERNDKILEIKQIVKECTSPNCGPDEKRVKEEGACCPSCERVRCLQGNETYEPNETWYLPDDPCTKYTCQQLDKDQMQTEKEKVGCPPVLANCPEEYLETSGCCQVCRAPPPETNCTAIVVPSASTVGLFRYNSYKYGTCVNTQPVEGFTECAGYCQSSSYYHSGENKYTNNCHCCKPTKKADVRVKLLCPGGSPISHTFKRALECTCSETCEDQSEEIIYKGKTLPEVDIGNVELE